MRYQHPTKARRLISPSGFTAPDLTGRTEQAQAFNESLRPSRPLSSRPHSRASMPEEPSSAAASSWQFTASMLVKAVFALLMGVAISGCESLTKQQIGTGLGATAGALIGGQFGGGKGKALAAASGAIAGGVLGNVIGAGLDQRDKDHAAAASRRAFDTGKTQTWSNPETGASGAVKVSDRPATPPARPAAAGRTCKTAKQEIVLKDGTTHTETITACKGPNGWEAI